MEIWFFFRRIPVFFILNLISLFTDGCICLLHYGVRSLGPVSSNITSFHKAWPLLEPHQRAFWRNKRPAYLLACSLVLFDTVIITLTGRSDRVSGDFDRRVLTLVVIFRPFPTSLAQFLSVSTVEIDSMQWKSATSTWIVYPSLTWELFRKQCHLLDRTCWDVATPFAI